MEQYSVRQRKKTSVGYRRQEIQISDDDPRFLKGMAEINYNAVYYKYLKPVPPLISTGNIDNTNGLQPVILFPKGHNPYEFFQYKFAQDPKVAEKVISNLKADGTNYSENFLRTPTNTVAFFADAHVSIDTLEKNNFNFFSDQDLVSLRISGRKGITRTRDLTQIIIKNYGKVAIGQFFPNGLDDRTPIWQKPSEIFAQRCSGEVLAIIGEQEGEIWNKQEKPALLKNKDVTVIIEIAPDAPQIPKQLIFPNGLKDLTQDIIDKYGIKINDGVNIDPNAILVLSFGTISDTENHRYSIDGRDTLILKSGVDFNIGQEQLRTKTKPLQMIINPVIDLPPLQKKPLEIVQGDSVSMPPLQLLQDQRSNLNQTCKKEVPVSLN